MSTAIGMCNTSSNSQQFISERRREFNTGLVLEKKYFVVNDTWSTTLCASIDANATTQYPPVLPGTFGSHRPDPLFRQTHSC